MKKKEIIGSFLVGHDEFKQVLKKLSNEQIKSVPAVGIWPVRKVIAHLSAWNWEQIKEIDRVLKNRPTWYRKKNGEISNTDLFNQKAVEKRKNWTIEKLVEEWQDSFDALINRINILSDEEWNLDGMTTIFKYELNGGSDENRHSKEIKKHFNV